MTLDRIKKQLIFLDDSADSLEVIGTPDNLKIYFIEELKYALDSDGDNYENMQDNIETINAVLQDLDNVSNNIIVKCSFIEWANSFKIEETLDEEDFWNVDQMGLGIDLELFDCEKNYSYGDLVDMYDNNSKKIANYLYQQ